MKANLSKEEILHILAAELPYLRQTYGVMRMALYGSFAQGLATSRSDVDLLVETSRPLGFQFIALADYLEKRLGRKVDLATFGDLSRSRATPRYQHIALNIERTLTDVQPAT